MFEITITFLHVFALGLFFSAPLTLFFITAILILGQIVGRREGWTRFDALYWSLVTALTIGYGDIVPRRRTCRILAIVVGLCGILLTGIFVAIALNAASIAYSGFATP